MKKTSARISEENHKELLKIVGDLQSKTGKFTTVDDVISELIKSWKKHSS